MSLTIKQLVGQVRKLLGENSDLVLQTILEELVWPSGLDERIAYERFEDDGGCSISVYIASNGDVSLIATRLEDTPGEVALRFNTAIGGGPSFRTRNALVLLALAIMLDNEQRSQEKPDKE